MRAFLIQKFNNNIDHDVFLITHVFFYSFGYPRSAHFVDDVEGEEVVPMQTVGEDGFLVFGHLFIKFFDFSYLCLSLFLGEFWRFLSRFCLRNGCLWLF
jgi:hypothetical protein